MVKSSRVDNIIILIISIVLISIFFIFNKDSILKFFQDSNNKSSYYFKTAKFDIDKEIKQYKKKYNVINVNQVNNGLTCLLMTDDSNKLSSVIIDNNNGDIIDPKDMFKKDTIEEVNAKIYELLSLKYASFIVDGIKNFPGDTIYEFKNNELIIYYKNYVFSPAYNKDIVLHVNYNEIKDYLDFKHRLDEEYENEDGFKYDPKKTTVAISFDDGPNSYRTKKILKALEDNKMCATFFMVGNKMNNQKDTINSVLLTHSEIGSHSYSHINMKRVKLDKVIDEFNWTNNIYKGITGMDLTLARPPYGAYTDDIIKDFNYSFILWNVDTNDWRYKDVDYLVDHILTHIEDGNIILMHDSYDTSVEAVLRVLPILYSKDIQVVSVSKLAELKGITLEKGKAYNYIK